MTHDEAMRHEFELGLDSLKESRQGAARFSGGQGRGGAAAQEEEEEGGPVEGCGPSSHSARVWPC